MSMEISRLVAGLLHELRDVIARHVELGQIELEHDVALLKVDVLLGAVAAGTGILGIALLEAGAACALAPVVGAAAACCIVGLVDVAAAVACSLVIRARLRDRHILATTRQQVSETVASLLGGSDAGEPDGRTSLSPMPSINPR